MKEYILAKLRKSIIYITVFSIIAISVFSSRLQIIFNTAALGSGSNPMYVWEGADFIVPSKISYEGGSGTSQDPYLISNGDQLYKMVYEQGKTNFGNGNAAWFKLQNDIYLNDVSGFDSWTEETQGLNDWFVKSELFSKEFAGNIDGANFTIYGLYTKENSTTSSALIPVVSSSGCTVKNLNIANAFVKSNKDFAILAGLIKGNSNFSCISVHDSKLNTRTSGGIVMEARNAHINFENCLVYNLSGTSNIFGIVGRKYDGNNIYKVTLKNCISLGYHPANYVYNTEANKENWVSYVYENVLTDKITSKNGSISINTTYIKANGNESQPSAIGTIYSITASEVKVDSDDNILSQNYGFDFINVWRATGHFPVFRNSDYWDGISSVKNYDFSIFTEGNGTKDDPYLIISGDQLYAMTVTGGDYKYFKLKNDIYLNDVKSRNINSLQSSALNDWTASSKIFNKAFNGSLDGAYHTVYGLYTSSGTAALIPECANAEIINLNIAKSKISGENASGIVGKVCDGKTAKLAGCSIYDTWLNGASCAGGLVAVGNGDACLEKCFSYDLTFKGTAINGGLIGNVTGSNSKLSDCYSVGSYPVGGSISLFTSSNVKNVYTDVSGTGVFTKLSTSQFKGETALDKGNLEFKSKEYWQLTTKYPMTRVLVDDPNSDKIWDGSSDDSWKNTGNGKSEDQPYIISSAAQLYNMIVSTSNPSVTYEGKYFKLNDDIYLNSVVYTDWYNMANNKWVVAEKTYFKGILDGGKHTVYGLYIDSDNENIGLFSTTYGNAVIKNLKISNAYIVGSSSGDQYAGALVGRTLSGKTEISRCMVDYNVLIGAKTSGGIIGCCGYTTGLTDKATIEHCSFVGQFIKDANGNYPSYKGGLIGNCFGAGISGKESVVTARDSFTTAEKTIDNGIGNYDTNFPVYQSGNENTNDALIQATAKSMFGSAAITVMPELDWGANWMVTAFYPEVNFKGYSVWSGGVASSYAGGTGSENDPFIIKNAEQLAKMVKDGGKNSSSKAAYFKVADGVRELYINDVLGMDFKKTQEYLTGSNDVKEWLYNSPKFVGTFNGNGVTIYGIYNNSASRKGGLLGTLDTNSFVYNVNLKNNVVISTDENTSAGVLSSEAGGKQIIVKNVAVSDSYVRGRWTAAIVGNATSSNIEFANCLVKNIDIDYNGKGVTNGGGAGGAGAIVSDGAWGSARVNITDCLTVGIYPVCYYRPNPQSKRFILKNVYTDVDLTEQSDYSSLSASATEKFAEIKLLSTEEITGMTNPKSRMLFDWNRDWETTSSYPVPKKHIVSNGVVGAVWSGNIADKFDGSGTETDPYIVDTAERLARMVRNPEEKAYYRISEDIRLNKISDSKWYEQTGLNVWNVAAPSFKAVVSGYNPETKKTATIYGLYIPDVQQGEYAGLFSTLDSGSKVKNIFIANAYLNGTVSTESKEGSTIGAIAGAVADKATDVIISSCMIEESVIIGNVENAGGIIGEAIGVGIVCDCASKVNFTGENKFNGAIVGRATGTCNILNAYCVGNFVSGKGGKTVNVYSDIDQKLSQSASGLDVKLLTKEQMIGENAKTNMTGFNFGKVWDTTDEYPVIIGEMLPFDGVPGEVWLGLTANNYAGGSGTKDDPYLIATGEQLYKMIKSSSAETMGKYYKLINDIKLNDVYSVNWKDKTSVVSWYTPIGVTNPFRGYFDGDYHIVSGIYNESTEGNYFGLFPSVGEGAVIENVGITDCYISISTVRSETYAACLVGYTQGYGRSSNVIIDREKFEADGNRVPVIRNCFADHTTYVEARYGGGIVCGVSAYVDVENCFFTGYVEGGDAIQKGAIVGDAWGKQSRIIKCYSAPLNITNFSGNSKIINAKSDDDVYIRDCYALSFRSIINVTLLPFERNKYGGFGVMDYAVGLDWENVWIPIKDGTPVLRGFDKHGHSLDEFSYKGAYTSTITFVTNAENVSVAPITADILSPLVLPNPTRYGYTFGGWYVYPELDAPYDRDYMIYRDITLYAKWIPDGVYQTFENYPNTEYDVGDDYVLYRPGVKNYSVNNVHGGGKSMHRIGNLSKESDVLLNYEDELKIGSEYEMKYWMMSDTSDASVKITLIHNTWPDINEPISKTEVILNETGMEKGLWKQYSYKFIATTPWVSFRTNGDNSLYLDDITIVPTGIFSLSGISYNGAKSPNTGDDYFAVKVFYSVCAVLFVMIAFENGKCKQSTILKKE